MAIEGDTTTTQGAAAPVTTTTPAPAPESNDTLLTGTNPTAAAPATVAGAEGGDKTADGKTAGEGGQSSENTYADFVMPEGVTLDESLLSEAVPIFKELGLTKDQAQKLVDLRVKQVAADSQKQNDAFTQQLDDWRTKSKNDSEYGGDKFDQSLSVARSAINKFGTPELKQLLNDYGVGNHPEIIRFMFRVGKLTTEDVPGNKGTNASKVADHVSILYPNEKA